MAQVNPLTREVLIKLVYYGPGLGGKTTTLQRVHGVSPAETRGKIVSLATPVDRTLYFDFLPLRVPPVKGYPVRLQLFTVPGQVYFNATRKLVLTGADGVVFVADSQLERQDANVESLQNLQANLVEQGRRLEDVPHVVQLNKRDLPEVASVAQLEQALASDGCAVFESSASRGEGVLEPLDELVRLVLEDLEQRQVFGDPVERIAARVRPPSFKPADGGLGESLSRASEEHWRACSEPAPDDVADSSVPPGPGCGEPTTAVPTAPTHPSSLGRTAESLAGVEGDVRRGPSWVDMFDAELQSRVGEIEEDFAAGDMRGAVLRCESVAHALLARVAERAALPPVERHPLSLALALGLAGDRWLGVSGAAAAAKRGEPVHRAQALEVFAVVLELRRLSQR